MKRKIVQHGPCTLTVSLPATWVRDFALKKGDEVNIEQLKEGLLVTAGKERHYGQRRISIKGMPNIIVKAIAALYKAGYDEIIVEYGSLEELERIHDVISAGFIGFEIVDETKEEVTIKKVSEPTKEEFKTLFRRIFHFLRSTADDSLHAAQKGDFSAHQKLILRDENINKFTDFCRRVVNKKGQQEYSQDTALYHVLEQIEKIGDIYKEINKLLLEQRTKPSKRTLLFYERVNNFLGMYEDLFFSFSLQKASMLLTEYGELNEEINVVTKQLNGDTMLIYKLQTIAREIYNLIGVTMILQL